MDKRKALDEVTKKIKEHFPEIKVEKNGYRTGKNPHLIIRNHNFVIENIEKIYPEVSDCGILSKYSSTYKTYSVKTIDGVAVFLCIRNQNNTNKINSIKAKLLTPQNLLLKNVYKKEKDFIRDLKKSLNNLYSNGLLKLNEIAKKEFPNASDDVLLKILLTIVEDDLLNLSQEEKKIFNAHKKTIEKDFGESLIPLILLKEKERVKEISFPKHNAFESYDISVVYFSGNKEKINIKSGNGSGQSLSTFLSQHQIEEIKNLKFEDGTDFSNARKILLILLTSEDVGVDKMSEIINTCTHFNCNKLDKILKKIIEVFFNCDYFDLSKVTDVDQDFNYIKELKSVFNLLNIKPIGIPKEENNPTTKEELKKALLFTCLTIVKNLIDQESINGILKNKVSREVDFIHFEINNYKINFKRIAGEYKLHYWGNTNRPLNNLLGIKAILK